MDGSAAGWQNDGMEPPEMRYAQSGDLRIAYQRFGSGPDVVAIPPLLTNVELHWEHELYRRVLEHAGRYVTMLQFDKRGIGCSDRFEQLPSLDERIGDITAVMDAEGIERASLLGASEGGLMALLFCARHPERVDQLTVMNSTPPASAVEHLPRYRAPTDPPFDSEEGLRWLLKLPKRWGHDPEFFVERVMPSQVDNASFVRWVGRLQRQSASPADIARQIQSVLVLDADDFSLSNINTPTLVIQVTGDRVCPPPCGRYVADRVHGARYLEVAGTDHFPWTLPHWREIIDTWIEQVIGQRPPCRSERRFGTVVFTDLVGSTAGSSRAGDDSWRETLDSHDRICRRVVDRHDGRIVKTTGDGLLGTFDSPSLAVDAAAALVKELASIGLVLRAGVHAGEFEAREDGDVSGTAVNIAARVEQAAEPGHVFVSSTVRDLLLGGDRTFTPRGDFTLKGIERPWQLYALDS
jgi:class 3 adenylate cyclase/pimeloyl-ACP methyl ester carboxylesterase